MTHTPSTFEVSQPAANDIIISTTPVDRMTLEELTVLSDTNPINGELVRNEYSNRFHRLTSPYLLNNASFSGMLQQTGGVISGTTALNFVFPHNEDPVAYASRHDLDIYVGHLKQYAVLEHLIIEQGYTIVHGPPHQDVPEGVVNHPYPQLNGVLYVYTLRRDNYRAHIIASSDERSAMLPIMNFHSTPLMNALTPTRFISLYPEFTLKKAGLIHHIAYPAFIHPSEMSFQTLRSAAQTHIQDYLDMGYTIVDSAHLLGELHTSACTTRSCRLYRYTNNSCILELVYGNEQTIKRSPLKPIAGWCIGGFECGRNDDTGVYEKFASSVFL